VFETSRKLDMKEGLKYFEKFIKSCNFDLDSLTTNTKVTYTDEEGKIKLNSFLLLKMPGLMRMEMLNVFEQPYFILNFSNEELYLYSVGDNRYEYRSMAESNLGYLFGEFDLLVPLIFGDFGYLNNFKLEKAFSHDGGKYIELILRQDTDNEKIQIDLLIESSKNLVYNLRYRDMTGKNNSKEYLIKYKKYDEISFFKIPISMELKFSSNSKEGSVKLNLSDTIINQAIKPTKFEFKLPDKAIRGRIPRIFDWLN
jgi:outer membrane lipoprotein-sorting protein